MTVIVAVGYAGGRMVNKIISAGRIEAEYLAINTDRRVLEACLAGRKILIGEQRFQGRGGAQPHIIMEEPAAAVEAIRQTCAGRVSVIIVAGLGCGTGTGIAPMVARIAQGQGCKTAAVCDKGDALGRPGRLGLCPGGGQDAGLRRSASDCIRLTPIDRDLFDDAVPADYLLPLALYPAINHTQRRH